MASKGHRIFVSLGATMLQLIAMAILLVAIPYATDDDAPVFLLLWAAATMAYFGHLYFIGLIPSMSESMMVYAWIVNFALPASQYIFRGLPGTESALLCLAGSCILFAVHLIAIISGGVFRRKK